jgi:hypothetical protein
MGKGRAGDYNRADVARPLAPYLTVGFEMANSESTWAGAKVAEDPRKSADTPVSSVL